MRRRPDRDRPVVLGGDHVNVMSGGGSLRVLTVDGRYEPSTWEHLRQFNILLDALPNIHMHINQVDPVDQTGPDFYRRLAAEMLTGTMNLAASFKAMFSCHAVKQHALISAPVQPSSSGVVIPAMSNLVV